MIAGALVLHLCLPVATSAYPPRHPSTPSSGPPDAPDYSRHFAEVTRHCQSLLASSAEELSVEADRAGALIRHLSFADGDWSQDAGEAPLLPFCGGSYHAGGAGKVAGPELLEAAPPLVSLRLTQVQAQRRGAFNVSGLLAFAETCDHATVEFRAPFKGVYTETRSSGSSGGGGGGGGERVLCMVGHSALPWRSQEATHLPVELGQERCRQQQHC